MSEEVERGPNGNRRWAMDFIPDKNLFKAVMFSRDMIRGGTRPQIAHHRAAKYYGVNPSDVARYVGQAAGTYAHRRRRNNG